MKKKWYKHVFIIVLLVNLSDITLGQVDSTSNIILNNLDSLRFAKIERKNFKIMPYVAPSYSPETEVLLTAGGLITFKAQKWNNMLNMSSVPFSIGFSSNGSLTVNIQNVIYWADDNVRTIGEFILRDMPDNYWGVGFENGLDATKSKETTFYRREYWRFFERVLFRTKGNLFVGGVIDLNGTKATEMNPVMEVDEYVLKSGSDIVNTGIGVVVEYDSRDFVQNAYKGYYLSSTFLFFQDFLGGNTKYRVLELEYRQYKMIKRERRTLAWNFKSRMSFGEEVPWSDMAMVGGPFNMRGYSLGRFRDKNMFTFTTEYRHMFKRKKLNKKGNYNSRFGYVGWAAIGTVTPHLGEFKNWLPNLGAGIRFEIQPKMNVRIDYGIARGEQGAYVTFTEAF